jgi:hypothetical protein
MMMNREINFDMDGTFVDLYGVENWLDYLMASDTTPYEVAKPLVNLSSLARLINRLQRNGYKVNIISWLSKTTDTEYNERVATAKLEWLAKHLPSVKWDKINIVTYGTPKQTLGCGILFDDEEPNRNAWNGVAYDVNNIIEILKNL